MSTLKLSFFKKQVLVLAFHVSTRYQVLPTSLARKPEKKKNVPSKWSQTEPYHAEKNRLVFQFHLT